MRNGSVIESDGKINMFAIEPPMIVEESKVGFTPDAELLNGRLAMIGFVSLLALEGITGHSLVYWVTTLLNL